MHAVVATVDVLDKTKRLFLSGLIRRRPTFSIIIPVLNESRILGSFLSHLKSTTQNEPTEIIVVDGQSSDSTILIAQEFANKVLYTTHPCRACQMHEGAKAAAGEILLFLHSDTKLPYHWQKVLLQAWRGETKPSVTAFRSGFDSNQWFYKIISTMAHWRTLWFTGTPHGDQAIAVERLPYLASGGFPHTPLMEEYFLMRKLRHRGPLKILSANVATSTRRYERNSPFLNNIRNLLIIVLFYLRVPTPILTKLYR